MIFNYELYLCNWWEIWYYVPLETTASWYDTTENSNIKVFFKPSTQIWRGVGGEAAGHIHFQWSIWMKAAFQPTATLANLSTNITAALTSFPATTPDASHCSHPARDNWLIVSLSSAILQKVSNLPICAGFTDPNETVFVWLLMKYFLNSDRKSLLGRKKKMKKKLQKIISLK